MNCQEFVSNLSCKHIRFTGLTVHSHQYGPLSILQLPWQTSYYYCLFAKWLQITTTCRQSLSFHHDLIKTPVRPCNWQANLLFNRQVHPDGVQRLRPDLQKVSVFKKRV